MVQGDPEAQVALEVQVVTILRMIKEAQGDQVDLGEQVDPGEQVSPAETDQIFLTVYLELADLGVLEVLVDQVESLILIMDT